LFLFSVGVDIIDSILLFLLILCLTPIDIVHLIIMVGLHPSEFVITRYITTPVATGMDQKEHDAADDDGHTSITVIIQ
jgi:hypothetical protein